MNRSMGESSNEGSAMRTGSEHRGGMFSSDGGIGTVEGVSSRRGA